MRGLLQLERAQWFALAWRGAMALAGLATLFFVGRLLTPTEQGYYFTFESLVTFRVVAELGLSQVIVQVASHEAAAATESRVKLAKLLRTGLRWYANIGAALGALLVAGGTLFFSTAGRPEGFWIGPWLTLSTVVALHFIAIPLLALLEGLGRVAEVMRLRFFETLVSYALLWAALEAGFGLWALPVFYFSSLAIQLSWLAANRASLLSIWRADDGMPSDFWRSEVLPFQWRLGVSWLAGYLVFQLLNPLVFRLRGPEEAGRIGMSLMAAQGVLTIGISVMRAKAPMLGRLIATRNWAGLAESWRNALHQTLIISALGSLILPLMPPLTELLIPGFSTRILEVPLMSLLAAATVLNAATQAMAVYLRAYKQEPLMWVSLVVAGISVAANAVAIPMFGNAGVAGVFLAIAALNCIWTVRVLVRRDADLSAERAALEGVSAA